MNDKELDAYCEEWVNWCYTRKFYVPPGAVNILARMQPSKTGEPPNARNSADMQYFNMAVHAMADMTEHQDAFACFRLMYIEQCGNVKRLAEQRGISRQTYYARAKAFSRKALSMSKSLKTATELMREHDSVLVD